MLVGAVVDLEWFELPKETEGRRPDGKGAGAGVVVEHSDTAADGEEGVLD